MDARNDWLQLLGQLDHMLQESERPAAQRLFRALGPRRLSTAQRQLRRERQALMEAAARWDLAIAPEDIKLAATAFTLCDNLAREYLLVADAYQRGASVAQERGEPALVRWMTVRARMHIEHSSFLDS
jgi:hypothetical protein